MELEKFNRQLPADLVPFLIKVHNPFGDMNQAVFRFPNDYGASIIMGSGSYGLELGVVEFYGEEDMAFELDFTTPIARDVLGHLTLDSMAEALRDIQKLPKSLDGRIPRQTIEQ